MWELVLEIFERLGAGHPSFRVRAREQIDKKFKAYRRKFRNCERLIFGRGKYPSPREERKKRCRAATSEGGRCSYRGNIMTALHL
jgi:hypothetical protein